VKQSVDPKVRKSLIAVEQLERFLCLAFPQELDIAPVAQLPNGHGESITVCLDIEHDRTFQQLGLGKSFGPKRKFIGRGFLFSFLLVAQPMHLP